MESAKLARKVALVEVTNCQEVQMEIAQQPAGMGLSYFPTRPAMMEIPLTVMGVLLHAQLKLIQHAEVLLVPASSTRTST